MVQAFASLKSYLDSQVLGQPALTEGILLALLANGHLLVEGPPGLAKTRAVNALAQGVEAEFHRIQFTPDLLPADLTGTDIYRPETGQFEFQSGPLFHHIILADEINRAAVACAKRAVKEYFEEHPEDTRGTAWVAGAIGPMAITIAAPCGRGFMRPPRTGAGCVRRNQAPAAGAPRAASSANPARPARSGPR